MSAEPRTQNLMLAAGIAAVACAIGCGGGDSDLSREDFVSQADRVCEQSSREFARIQRTRATSAEQAERQVGALIEVESDALGELRDLEPPEDLRSRYERYLQARERALGFLEDGREAAASNDPQAYNAAKRRASAEQAERLQLARRSGLRHCSRPAVTLGG
jgi:hypothetical protein